MAINKTTKLYKQVRPHYREILEGKFLAIDPSTGSGSSMPGFAWFEKGVLKESGTIEVSPAARKNIRLFNIAESFRNEFDKPDVIAIENIPPMTFKGGMSQWSLVSLQRAIGAIVSVFPCTYIEVAPIAWRNFIFEGYQKSDSHDAICIGLCVLAYAKEVELELSEDK